MADVASSPETPPKAPAKPYSRALIIGASLSAGLGYSGTSFAQIAAADLAGDFLDLSLSGQRTKNLIAAEDEITRFGPDLVIGELGFAEAMVHPVRRIQDVIERWAPDSWHGVAGLEPRARYSSKTSRRVRQMANSHVKVWVKYFLFEKLSMGEPLVPFDESLDDAEAFLEFLGQTGAHVVLLGVPKVDGHLFPRTDRNFEQWNGVVEKLAENRPGSQFVALAPAIREWEDYLPDRLHLNESGHARAAEVIIGAVRRHAAVSRGGRP